MQHLRGCTDGEADASTSPKRVTQRSPHTAVACSRVSPPPVSHFETDCGGFEAEIACQTPLDESGVHTVVFYRSARTADRSGDG